MELRQLGRSGLKFSTIGYGCWSFANDKQWGNLDESEAIRAVHRALDLGVNHFDTAEGYGRGHSEELLGKALKGRRSEALICTKAGGSYHQADTMPDGLNASLKRLSTDYVDLYYLHWPNRNTPFAETMGALERLKEQGKIRAIGVSNFGPLDLADMLQHGTPAANQLPYNLFWRTIEFEIVPKCVEADIGIVCYSPLAQGLLTGRYRSKADIPSGTNRARTRLYQDEVLDVAFPALEELRKISDELGATPAQVSLAWLISKPGVTCVIPGARDRKQLENNVGAGELKLDQDMIKRLDELSQPLKDHFGPNPDMWSGTRYR